MVMAGFSFGTGLATAPAFGTTTSTTAAPTFGNLSSELATVEIIDS